MAQEEGVKIDGAIFHERLSSFLTTWKNDKRAGDAIFGGASSLILLSGKSEEAAGFYKTGAFQVRNLATSEPSMMTDSLHSYGY